MISSFWIPAWKLYDFKTLGHQFPAPLQSQESLGPFPWPRGSSTVPDCRLQAEPGQGYDGQSADVLETTPALAAKGIVLDSEQPVSSSTTDLPKLHGKDSAVNVGAQRFCESLEFLDYKLPPPGVSAGRVLQHAKSVLSTHPEGATINIQGGLHTQSNVSLGQYPLRLPGGSSSQMV